VEVRGDIDDLQITCRWQFFRRIVIRLPGTRITSRSKMTSARAACVGFVHWRSATSWCAVNDGSPELYFPQPDHPEMLAFRARMTLH
jgi:hypothetical protein